MQRASIGDPALPDLRDQFPDFRIWQEITGNRTRYIARRLRPGIHPHTVVTADLAELGAELSTASAQPVPGGAMTSARPRSSAPTTRTDQRP